MGWRASTRTRARSFNDATTVMFEIVRIPHSNRQRAGIVGTSGMHAGLMGRDGAEGAASKQDYDQWQDMVSKASSALRAVVGVLCASSLLEVCEITLSRLP